jgi:hypothetical protein
VLLVATLRGHLAARIRPACIAALALAGTLVQAAPARADWHLAPFLGVKFGGATTLIDLDDQAGKRKLTYGGTVTWMGRGIFGLEGDVGFVSNPLESERSILVRSSHAISGMGNVVVTAPLGWTRDSLRPYASGGLGFIRVRMDDPFNSLPYRRTLGGYNVGGGVVGFLTPFTGVKWDVRYFKGWGPAGEGTSLGSARISYWRGTMSLVLKY